MRPLLFLPLLALGACASPLPQPDPQKAWISMVNDPANTLMAHKKDGAAVNDGRYFQVSPGAHELVVRYLFEVPSGAQSFGAPSMMTCHLRLKYDGFVAGQRYRVEARPQLYKARAWLYDEQRQVLARSQVVRCSTSI